MNNTKAAEAMREACTQIIRNEWAMKTYTYDTQSGHVFRLSAQAKNALKAIRTLKVEEVLK